MSSLISLTGKIHFEPEDKTKKHVNQSSWKKMALVLFKGDVAEYYAWFLAKRYSIILNKPLRGAHISFINDSVHDLRGNGKSIDEVDQLWSEVKSKWDNKAIEVTLSLEPRSDGRAWWLNVPQDKRDDLQSIRTELGLGKPYFGMHMTIGHANEKNINHSNYILRLLKSGLIN
jgi:hypothetical protein